MVEQHPDRFAVEGLQLQLLERHVALDVGAQPAHRAVREHAIARRTQVLALLRGKRVEMLIDAFEIVVGGDQLRRGLLADTGNAGEVVGAVAPQGRVVDVLPRCDTTSPFDDARFVVLRVVRHAALVVEHLDVRVAHELERVAVAGDDHDVDAVVGGEGGQRGDHVVGLHAWDREPGDLERVDHLVDQRELSPKQIWCGAATRLVFRVECVPFGGSAGRVERNRERVGLLVGDHLREHRREPVGRVRDGSRRGDQIGRQREERSVCERVTVQQQELHELRRPTVGGSADDERPTVVNRPGARGAGRAGRKTFKTTIRA